MGGSLTLILGWGAQALILGLEGADSTWGGRRPSYWGSLTLILGLGAQTPMWGGSDPHYRLWGADPHVEPGGGGAQTPSLWVVGGH